MIFFSVLMLSVYRITVAFDKLLRERNPVGFERGLRERSHLAVYL